MYWKQFLAAATLVLSATSASATIIGVSPTGGSTGNLVINNACVDGFDGGASGALLITGCLNTDHTTAGDVDFTSDENIVFGTGGGQATVSAYDGLTQTLTIDPRTFQLTELIVDINSAADGEIRFCDNNGCWGSLLTLDKNGSNFFDVTFSPSASFLTLTTFDSTGQVPTELIEGSKQWRVGVDLSSCGNNCPVTRVPEPGTVALFSAGLLGLAAVRRRRKPQA
jgi:PEP-CTERM motif-containing protein